MCLYNFGYFALCSLVVFRVIYKCQKQINCWKMIQEMLLWYEKRIGMLFFTKICIMAKRMPFLQTYLALYINIRMEGYYVKDCSL